MCSADISVISWYMPEASSPEHTPNPLPRFDQTRMCRDFHGLRDWARSRTPDAEGLEGSRTPLAVMPQAPPERPNQATRGAVPLTVAERAKATLGKGSLRAVLPNLC